MAPDPARVRQRLSLNLRRQYTILIVCEGILGMLVENTIHGEAVRDEARQALALSAEGRARLGRPHGRDAEWIRQAHARVLKGIRRHVPSEVFMLSYLDAAIYMLEETSHQEDWDTLIAAMANLHAALDPELEARERMNEGERFGKLLLSCI